MTTEKFSMTEQQMEKVIELLNSNGYKARKSKWETEIVITSRPSERYVTLEISEVNGVYISTTGTWLDEIGKAELYTKELIAASKIMLEIHRITGFGKLIE